MEEAKKQLIEAAEAAQPKTEAEAILSQGGIPSNTADLLKQRQTSETAHRAAHEGTQGTVRIPSLLSPLLSSTLIYASSCSDYRPCSGSGGGWC